MVEQLTLSGNDEEVMQEIAQYIRNTRILKGFTLDSVAQSAGVDRSYLLKIEKGRKRHVTIYMLVRLMNALDLEIEIKEQQIKKKWIRN